MRTILLLTSVLFLAGCGSKDSWRKAGQKGFHVPTVWGGLLWVPEEEYDGITPFGWTMALGNGGHFGPEARPGESVDIGKAYEAACRKRRGLAHDVAIWSKWRRKAPPFDQFRQW